MATENILMYCVNVKGGDRQALHEAIRVHSVAAANVVKEEGGDNDLLDRILADKTFGLGKKELDSLLDVKQFTGRAEEQVEEYIAGYVTPVLDANRQFIAKTAEIKV